MDYANGKMISRKEQKIWDELEYEIEKELEEEIKDGLLMLARRLQILYQHKERRSKFNDAATPDLSIVIRPGIDCDIEIKDGKLDDDRSRPHTPCSEPCLKKNCNPSTSSHCYSQFGYSKSSLTMSNNGSAIRTSKRLRKKCNKGEVVWKY